MTDFERMAAGTAQNWRDIADLGMASTLRDPEVRGPVVDGERCFSRHVYLYSLQTGELVRTVIIRTVFRVSDRAVLTSYRSQTHCR